MPEDTLPPGRAHAQIASWRAGKSWLGSRLVASSGTLSTSHDDLLSHYRRATRRRANPPVSGDPLRSAAALGVGRIDHLGIAVRSIDELLPFYRDGLGLEVGAVEEVPGMGVRVLKLPVGASTIELIEGTDPAGVIAKFVASKGPGIHHVCLEVADLDAATARLRARGCTTVFESPRTGAGGHRVNFLKPADAGGVLYELVECSGGSGD